MTAESLAPLAAGLVAMAVVKAFKLPFYPHQLAVFGAVFWIFS